MVLFLCGDVMTGRGIDQILPHASDPVLYEPYVQSALEYVTMGERAHGEVPKPVDFSYIWGDALEEIAQAGPEARIVNLETSITTCGRFESKGINYRMHPSNTPCLTAANIDCCVLANNHVLDWGRIGLRDTLGALRRAGIQTAGAGNNLEEAWRPAVAGKSKVLVFAAGTVDSGIDRSWAVEDSVPGVALLPDLSEQTARLVEEKVAEAKEPGQFAIVSLHWGGNWGYRIPTAHQAFARRLIDSGVVDLVHGHSSHHPKGIEVYREKAILYGCGDFLNDYEGIAGYEEFRSDIALAYFVHADTGSGHLLGLEMAPFEIQRFRLQHASPDAAAWIRDVLTREGSALGTRTQLDACGQLVLDWRKS